MSIIIREAQSDDVNSIAGLLISNWQKTYKGLLPDDYLNGMDINYGKDKWLTFLNQDEHTILVAYQGNIFLGFGAFHRDDEIRDCLYLSSLHISEESRGKGIGTRLIQAIGNYAFQNKYACISICIIKGNEKAKNLYIKLGAIHYKDFTDDIDGIEVESEKLIWNNLELFNPLLK